MLDAVIGLGSNLGDSRRLLATAALEIERLGRPRGRSSLYETEPVGPPQPRFLNAALRLDIGLAPDALLEALLGIERRLGRVRNERWGPRLIDLDILWAKGTAVATPALSVPHPELRKRAFALFPLLERRTRRLRSDRRRFLPGHSTDAGRERRARNQRQWSHLVEIEDQWT